MRKTTHIVASALVMGALVLGVLLARSGHSLFVGRQAPLTPAIAGSAGDALPPARLADAGLPAASQPEWGGQPAAEAQPAGGVPAKDASGPSGNARCELAAGRCAGGPGSDANNEASGRLATGDFSRGSSSFLQGAATALARIKATPVTPGPEPTLEAAAKSSGEAVPTPAREDGGSPAATGNPQTTAGPDPASLEAAAWSSLVPPDRIVAPTIGLDSPVVTVGWHVVNDPGGGSHTEWDVASYAVGWQKNSAVPGQVGNVVLTGHNNIEGSVFRNLDAFQDGDAITLYAGGRTFDYYVTDKFVVQEAGVPYSQQLANAKWIGTFPDARLTLVSCYPPTGNTERIFIIARPKG